MSLTKEYFRDLLEKAIPEPVSGIVCIQSLRDFLESTIDFQFENDFLKNHSHFLNNDFQPVKSSEDLIPIISSDSDEHSLEDVEGSITRTVIIHEFDTIQNAISNERRQMAKDHNVEPEGVAVQMHECGSENELLTFIGSKSPISRVQFVVNENLVKNEGMHQPSQDEGILKATSPEEESYDSLKEEEQLKKDVRSKDSKEFEIVEGISKILVECVIDSALAVINILSSEEVCKSGSGINDQIVTAHEIVTKRRLSEVLMKEFETKTNAHGKITDDRKASTSIRQSNIGSMKQQKPSGKENVIGSLKSSGMLKTKKELTKAQKLSMVEEELIGHKLPKKPSIKMSSVHSSRDKKAAHIQIFRNILQSDEFKKHSTIRNKRKQVSRSSFDNSEDNAMGNIVYGKNAFSKGFDERNIQRSDGKTAPKHMKTQCSKALKNLNECNPVESLERETEECYCVCSFTKGSDGFTYHTLCYCCGPSTNF